MAWDSDTLRLALEVRERHGVVNGPGGPACPACVVAWPCWPFHLSQLVIRSMFREQDSVSAEAPTGDLWVLAGGRRDACRV